MRAGIHPKYVETSVTCGCGNSFTTRSTTDRIVVEICSNCHPFYTGKQKFVDTAGRVERFKKRWGSLDERKEKDAGTAGKKQRRQKKTVKPTGLKSLPVQEKKGPPPRRTEPEAPAPKAKSAPKKAEAAKPEEKPKTPPPPPSQSPPPAGS